MSDDIILTTPPVHDAGPDTVLREIQGGEATKIGLDSRLRDEFARIADELAARNTRTVIAVPVKQLVEATIKVVGDLPRVPDYDAVTAHLTRWEQESEYSPSEVPDTDPDSIGVFVRDQGPDLGKVCIELTQPGQDTTHTLDFEPGYIEHFFLAGLAACAYSKAQARLRG
jgi:hypothetical protein